VNDLGDLCGECPLLRARVKDAPASRLSGGEAAEARRHALMEGGIEALFKACAVAPRLAGEAVLCGLERGVPVIAVEENVSVLEVTAERLGVEVLRAVSYAEAAGWVLALREGLDPQALRHPLRLGVQA
jgi:hypothetical protein